LRAALALSFLIACCAAAHADEVLVNFGGGPQPHSAQHNTTFGFDYSFYRFERSPRQHIEVGASYTRLSTNAPVNGSLYALSVYPQLTFWPAANAVAARHAPSWARPFFFVRALGPSYISENALGTRQQAKHFAFQAQIGVGALIKNKTLLMISWKHFSNANLFSDNDGIDLPLVLHVGVRF
jgi:lipid A 3-O-deacylase